MRSQLFFVFAAFLMSTPAVHASSCQSEDGNTKVTMSVENFDSLFGGEFQSTLEINDEEIPRVREYCVVTPGIQTVVRCPHLVAPDVQAQVYPKFNNDGVLTKAFVVHDGQPSIELKDCE